jgi:hypothetical protein
MYSESVQFSCPEGQRLRGLGDLLGRALEHAPSCGWSLVEEVAWRADAWEPALTGADRR